jgi:hypothetical protein
MVGEQLMTLAMQPSLIFCAFPSVIQPCSSLALHMKCSTLPSGVPCDNDVVSFLLQLGPHSHRRCEVVSSSLWHLSQVVLFTSSEFL